MYRSIMCAATGVLFVTSQAVAQQNQHISFKVPDQNNKFIVSQNVEIGDVPSQIVRLFDSRAIPSKAVIVNGLELGEFFTRGVADFIEGNGAGSSGYLVFVSKNGDRFFSRNRLIAQTASGKIVRYIGRADHGWDRKICGYPRSDTHFLELRYQPRRCA